MTTRQTKSFITLCVLAVVLTYAAILVTRHLPTYSKGPDVPAAQEPEELMSKVAEPEVIDVATWSTYTDPAYPVSFKYPAEWSITAAEPTSTLAWYVITTAPSKSADAIRVYINDKNYFAMEGITTENTTINGLKAISAQGLLVGIKQGKNYYTFDAGTDVTLQPYFTELVKTISIK
jgi:hypothetical protein